MSTLHTLNEIAHGTIHGDGDLEVRDIGLDSKALPDGALFAALPGTRVHGAQFAADTPAAAAILTDAQGVEILRAAGESRPVIEVADIRAVLGHVAAEIYGHPTDKLTVVGVTGTSGKTTTSYLVEAGLLAAGKSVGLIGTTGTRINREPVPTTLTTPEAPTLQALFARMVSEGVTHVVMEVSSHALELGRVAGTRFAVGGFTNLSQDHLDFHPTMEEYFWAKARLFGGKQGAEHAVCCIDDDWGQRMAEVARDAGHTPVIVGTSAKVRDAKAPGRVYAHQKAVDATGAQDVALAIGDDAYELHLPLPGEFNIANAALAVGMATCLDGVELTEFLRGIENVAVPGRMERVDRGQDFIAVVDYAHKPAAIEAVLQTLRGQLKASPHPGGGIAIVVGAGGDRDSTKRPLMGAAAAAADFVVVTDDNPRTEDPAPIRQAVAEGARKALRADDRATEVEVVDVDSRARAIDVAVDWVGTGDAVIVVGKGHEVGQIVGTETIHFDDREELARAVEEKLSGRGHADSAGGDTIVHENSCATEKEQQ